LPEESVSGLWESEVFHGILGAAIPPFLGILGALDRHSGGT
jgi:hypothetical protein